MFQKKVYVYGEKAEDKMTQNKLYLLEMVLDKHDYGLMLNDYTRKLQDRFNHLECLTDNLANNTNFLGKKKEVKYIKTQLEETQHYLIAVEHAIDNFISAESELFAKNNLPEQEGEKENDKTDETEQSKDERRK